MMEFPEGYKGKVECPQCHRRWRPRKMGRTSHNRVHIGLHKKTQAEKGPMDFAAL